MDIYTQLELHITTEDWTKLTQFCTQNCRELYDYPTPFYGTMHQKTAQHILFGVAHVSKIIWLNKLLDYFIPYDVESNKLYKLLEASVDNLSENERCGFYDKLFNNITKSRFLFKLWKAMDDVYDISHIISAKGYVGDILKNYKAYTSKHKQILRLALIRADQYNYEVFIDRLSDNELYKDIISVYKFGAQTTIDKLKKSDKRDIMCMIDIIEDVYHDRFIAPTVIGLSHKLQLSIQLYYIEYYDLGLLKYIFFLFIKSAKDAKILYGIVLFMLSDFKFYNFVVQILEKLDGLDMSTCKKWRYGFISEEHTIHIAYVPIFNKYKIPIFNKYKIPIYLDRDEHIEETKHYAQIKHPESDDLILARSYGLSIEQIKTIVPVDIDININIDSVFIDYDIKVQLAMQELSTKYIPIDDITNIIYSYLR